MLQMMTLYFHRLCNLAKELVTIVMDTASGGMVLCHARRRSIAQTPTVWALSYMHTLSHALVH